jgi:uridylate kinase
MIRFKRVLLKLSGGALAANKGFGFEKEALEHIANEVIALRKTGVELAIMVGGGNIFRGNTAEKWAIERAEADNIGTMATVINSLILRGILTTKGAGEVRVMTAAPMEAIAEPYIRLRAIHHLEKGYLVILAGGIGQPYVTTDYPAVQRAIEIRADVVLMAKHGVNGVYTANPRSESNARRYKTMTYDEVIRNGFQVADQSAFMLARDYKLPIYIFDFFEKDCMKNICEGEDIGTYISDDCSILMY